MSGPQGLATHQRLSERAKQVWDDMLRICVCEFEGDVCVEVSHGKFRVQSIIPCEAISGYPEGVQVFVDAAVEAVALQYATALTNSEADNAALREQVRLLSLPWWHVLERALRGIFRMDVGR